jgi:hypothetical protein
VAQAPDPDWHYVIVSLSDLEPVLRSYRVVAGAAEEEAVVLSAPVRQQDELGGVKPTSPPSAGNLFGQPGG